MMRGEKMLKWGRQEKGEEEREKVVGVGVLVVV